MSEQPRAKGSAFLEAESRFTGRFERGVFSALAMAYAPFAGKIAALLAVGWFGRLALLSTARLIGVWVDQGASMGDLGHLAAILGLTLLGFTSTVVYRIGFARTSSRAISRLYDEATLRTSRFPMAFFDATPVGRIITRYTSDYSNLVRIAGGPLSDFFNIVFDISICLAMIALASPWYLPGCAAIGLLNFGVYRLNLGKLRRERRRFTAARSPAIAHFAETTQGGKTIRAFSRQRVFAERFATLDWQFQAQKLKTVRAILWFSVQMAASNGLLLLVTGLVGHRLLATGQTTLGTLGAAFAFVVLIGSNLQMFFDYFAQLEDALTSAERLTEYLRKPLEPGQRLPATAEFDVGHPRYDASKETEREPPGSRAASVEVSDLWFRYRADLPWVLRDVGFHIPERAKLGIIGKTGSGKSSLIQVLFRLYAIDRGQVRIGGVSAEEADLNAYRRAIALIPQDPILFQGTLRDNLAMVAGVRGDDDRAIDPAIHDALDRVGLSRWLKRQKMGLDSPVFERGANFSQGERQLICMARCLLQNSPVVILDEATSSVDPQSEEIMVRATREIFADRTQLIVAHRLSTLSHCDHLLKLSQGEVEYFGPKRGDLATTLFLDAHPTSS